VVAAGFSGALYWVEDQFEKLPFDALWWPALGGIVVGLAGFVVPRILGVGYGTISDLLNDRLAVGLVAAVLGAKAIALLVSIGSGTSGGLLAPMFTIGAAVGSLYATLINHFHPAAALSPSAFALVGMAALFGSAARAPFTFIIFAFELTRNYDAVLPLMLVVVVAYAISLLLMENSIMTEKLARRGLRVHQEYEVDVFQTVTVGEVMDAEPAVVSGQLSVGEITRRISLGEPALVRHQALLLADEKGELAGIVTRGDLVRAFDQDQAGQATLLEAGEKNPQVAYPDETLHEALACMSASGIGRLPVVERAHPKKIVGYLGRAAILEARRKRLHEDHSPEPGWLGRRKRTRAMGSGQTC